MKVNEDYLKLLEKKKVNVIESGFEIKETDLSQHLFDFQKILRMPYAQTW